MMKAEIRMRKKTSLKTRAYGFFSLFFFVSLALGVMIIYAAAVPEMDEQILTVLSRVSSDQEVTQTAAIDIVTIFKQLQDRILWIILISLSGGLIISILIVRDIMGRLEKVTKVAAKISTGHLGESVPGHPSDEIGAIERVINNFAVNLQEVLLLLWNQTQICLKQLNQMDENNEKSTKTSTSLEERLQHMRNDLEEMQAIIRSFDFYGVCFEDGKLITKQDRV
jgi:methyl-accepting chemotaxis protein